jgi:hypothetical protein
MRHAWSCRGVPQDFRHRMNLTDVQQIGDIAFLRYQLKEPTGA